jgi:hypothetical protein
MLSTVLAEPGRLGFSLFTIELRHLCRLIATPRDHIGENNRFDLFDLFRRERSLPSVPSKSTRCARVRAHTTGTKRGCSAKAQASASCADYAVDATLGVGAPKDTPAKPCANAVKRACVSESSAGKLKSTPTRRRCSASCAPAASGQNIAPPRSVMDSRRLMGFILRPRTKP